jgi:hypothetical protein
MIVKKNMARINMTIFLTSNLGIRDRIALVFFLFLAIGFSSSEPFKEISVSDLVLMLSSRGRNGGELSRLTFPE